MPCTITLICFEVDRASTSKIGSSARLAEKILNHEGGSRAFYRGFGPNLLGNSVSWALYFAFYDALKNGISCFRSDTRPLSYQDYFLASGIAGMCKNSDPIHKQVSVVRYRDVDNYLHKPDMGHKNSNAFNSSRAYRSI